MSSFDLPVLTSFSTVTSMDFHPTELIIAVSLSVRGTYTSRDYLIQLLQMQPDGTIRQYPNPIAKLPNEYFSRSIGSPVAFSPSGQFLATGDLSNKSDVILWQVLPNSPSGNPVSYFTGQTGYINSIAFDPTGRFFATGSVDNTARVWQVRTDGTPATCLTNLTDHISRVSSVAFSPTGYFLATGSWDNTVKLWCRDTNWTCISSLDQSIVGGIDGVDSIAFHPILPLLAVGLANGTVTLWQKKTDDDTNWTHLKTMKDHEQEVHSVAFHPDGLFLATGSYDRTVKIWMLTNDKNVAKCVHTLFCVGMVNQIRFHRGGKFMAVVTYEGTFILYDTSVLIQKKTELLATQGTARLLAQRLSTDPTSTDRGLDIRREQKITREVDAANPPLQVALLNSREADANAKANRGKGGRISRKKRKINKRHSYRK
jgi:WD40 repeat protein